MRFPATSDHLQTLMEVARFRSITKEEGQEQRQIFAYGNTKIEDDKITREMVDEVDDALQVRAQAHQ